MNIKILAAAAVLIIAAAGAGIFFFSGEDAPEIALADGVIEREYIWSFGGQTYSLMLAVPAADYCAAKAVPRGTVTLQSYASYIDSESACVTALSKALVSAAGTQNTAAFMLSFVQSLRYQTDIEGTGYTEYPKYPVETLVDAKGDCEDLVGLYVSLLRNAGYDAVMIFIPTGQTTGHMAAGVAGSYSGGGIMDKNGVIYHYTECTAKGWSIGEVPATIPFGTDGTKILGGSS